MKIPALALLLPGILLLNAEAELAAPPKMTPATPSNPCVVVERGANYRKWQKTLNTTNAAGKVESHVQKYTELATGVCYKDINGKWADSREVIEPQISGGALASQGTHQVYFPSDIYTDTLKITTSDCKTLKSHPAVAPVGQLDEYVRTSAKR